MGAKFTLSPNPILTTNYRLQVVGLPDIPFVTVGGVESEIPKVEIPDKTQASTGRTNPGEFEVAVPAHEFAAIAAMDLWFNEGQDPIIPSYKKTGNLTNDSGNNISVFNTTLIGVWVSKKGTPDLAMGEDGDMSVITYTLCYDDIL